MLSAIGFFRSVQAAILGHVEVDSDFFLTLELHDKERVLGLPLTYRRIDPDSDDVVDVIRLRKQEELLDMLVRNLVVVCLSAKTEGSFVHVQIETTTGSMLASRFERRYWR